MILENIGVGTVTGYLVTSLLSTKSPTYQIIFYNFYYVKTSSKIQKSSKSIKYIKSYQENMIEFLNKSILFILYLNLKSKSDFQVNP